MEATVKFTWTRKLLFSVSAGALLIGLKRGADMKPKGYRNTPFWRVFDRLTTLVDQKRGWHRLPTR